MLKQGLLAAAALATARNHDVARTGLAQLRLAADPTKCVAIAGHKRAGPGSRAVIWACDPQKRPSGQLFTYNAANGTISYGDYCLRVLDDGVGLSRSCSHFFWDAFGSNHIEHGRLCLSANTTENGAPLVAGAACLAFALDKWVRELCGNRICSMAGSFYAIDATSSRWPPPLDGVRLTHNLIHWLISTQVEGGPSSTERAFQEQDDCALLTQRAARFPAFAFTSPFAVAAPSTPALRVASRSLDEFLADDVPRFALGTGSTPGWTTCDLDRSQLRRFVAFERVLWLDDRTLAVGDLGPLFRMALDARVAVTPGATLVRPDAFADAFARLANTEEDPWAGVQMQQLDAAEVLIEGDVTRWEAEALKADAADEEKRRVAAAHQAVFVTGYWSMPSEPAWKSTTSLRWRRAPEIRCPRRSKHASSLYSKWIGHLMEVRVPMVIFTNDKAELKKKRLQHGHGRLTKFVHREIAEFHTQRAFGDVWQKDFSRDREAHIHKSPRLYAIWAEKLEHVEIVRRRQFFGDIEALFWIDIGVLRDTGAQYRLATGRAGAAWPRPSRVEAIVATDSVHISAAMPCWGPREFARPDQIDGRFDKKNHVCACIFGGSLGAIKRTRLAYYDLTKRFIARNKFSGKDQSVWNFLVVQNRSFLSLVVPDRCPGDRWFAMVPYLADACHGPPSRHYEGRTCLRDVSAWSGHPEEGLGPPLPTVTR